MYSDEVLRGPRYSSRGLRFFRASRSMRHRVDHVINADADPQRGEFFRVARVVGPLPGITHVGVERHRNHYPAVVVVDAEPVSLGALGALRHEAAPAPAERPLA